MNRGDFMEQDIDKRMEDIKSEILQKDLVKSEVDRLVTFLNQKQKEISDFLVILEKEQHDVDALQKLSLSSLIASIANNKVEKLKKEQLDLLNAKMKHTRLLSEMDAIRTDFELHSKQYNHILSLEKQYRFLIQDKRELLLKSDSKPGIEIKNRMDEIEKLKNQIWEVKETIRVGQSAIQALTNSINQLSSAQTMGFIDILSKRDNIFSSVAKYNHIDGAQKSMSSSRLYIDRFQKRLSDVKFGIENTYLEISNASFGFDTYFDNIFTDYAVEQQISGSKSSLSHIKTGIETKVNQLTELVHYFLEQIDTIQNSIDKGALILSICRY